MVTKQRLHYIKNVGRYPSCWWTAVSQWLNNDNTNSPITAQQSEAILNKRLQSKSTKVDGRSFICQVDWDDDKSISRLNVLEWIIDGARSIVYYAHYIRHKDILPLKIIIVTSLKHTIIGVCRIILEKCIEGRKRYFKRDISSHASGRPKWNSTAASSLRYVVRVQTTTLASNCFIPISINYFENMERGRGAWIQVWSIVSKWRRRVFEALQMSEWMTPRTDLWIIQTTTV